MPVAVAVLRLLSLEPLEQAVDVEAVEGRLQIDAAASRRVEAKRLTVSAAAACLCHRGRQSRRRHIKLRLRRRRAAGDTAAVALLREALELRHLPVHLGHLAQLGRHVGRLIRQHRLEAFHAPLQLTKRLVQSGGRRPVLLGRTAAVTGSPVPGCASCGTVAPDAGARRAAQLRGQRLELRELLRATREEAKVGGLTSHGGRGQLPPGGAGPILYELTWT